MLPRIAITPWRRPLPTSLGERTDLYTLDPAYAGRVADAGGLPLIVPRSEDAEAVLDLVDGLMISGGGDMDPAQYGAVDSGLTYGVDASVDAWEIALIQGARRRGLPVLGICRGTQVLAVAAGGRLHQDIGVDDDHPALETLDPEDILVARHAVRIEPGTLLAGLFPESTVQVNTIHHQAVEHPGDLVVSARSTTGVIEAIEDPSGAPVVGVQWHPEKMHEPEQRALFRFLVEAARARLAQAGGPIDAR